MAGRQGGRLAPVAVAPVTAIAVVVVAALFTDLRTQPVEATVEVLPLPRGQAATPVARLKLFDLAELGAKGRGFPAAERAVANADHDASFEIGLTGIDRLPAASGIVVP